MEEATAERVRVREEPLSGFTHAFARRTKVIGRFPSETICLTLVWAVLDLYITHATNGIKFTQLERQRLKRIGYEGSERTHSEEVTAA